MKITPNRIAHFFSRGQQQVGKAEKQVEVLVYKTTTGRRWPSMAQFQYITKLMARRELWLFWCSIVVTVVAALALSLRWYGRSTEIVPEYGGTYTEGLVGAPVHVNPLLSALSDVDADLVKLVFSGLFRYNDQQVLEPDLITNYVESDDQLTYTFFLNPNITWHDSERFDADDVLFTIAAIQDPLYQSPLQPALAGVRATKLDDFSFSLTLVEPYAPFLSTLTFGILPEHLWYNVPAQNMALTDLNIRPVGTGPYKFASLVKDKAGNIKSMSLVRNEEYHDDLSYLDELNFIFYPDVPSAVEALAAKKLKGLSFIPHAEKAGITKQNNNARYHSLRLPQYMAIFFNQSKSEVLKDKTVRQALATATNREEIIQQVLAGEGEAIYTAILPGYVGHNSEVEKYPFNIEAAVKMLEEAGWKYPEPVEPVADEGEETPAASTGAAETGADETSTVANENTSFVPREKDGVKLEFTVSTVERPEFQQTLKLLQNNWQAIGVKVNTDFYSPEDIQNLIIKKREYEALLFGEIVGTDPDPYPFWHSSQQEHPGLSLAIFRDREIDKLLEEARKTTDEEQRRLKYLHFQNNLAAEVAAIFLYNPLYTYGIDRAVQGVHSQYITVPADRFAGINQWYIKTQRKFR